MTYSFTPASRLSQPARRLDGRAEAGRLTEVACAHEPDAAGGVPRVDVVIAVIIRGGQVLICRRAAGASFAGFWEFPGGKREPGETIAQCLGRELREELAVRVEPFHALKTIDHDYPSGRIRLHPYVCHLIEGEPKPIASHATRWVEPRELTDYPFPPANERLIDEVIHYLSLPPRSIGSTAS